MLIGYARVSTRDQNLELQRDALTKAGCERIYEDMISGTRADRPGLAKAREMMREGDTLSFGSWIALAEASHIWST